MAPLAQDNRSAREARWEHYDHGADIGVRGFGASKARAFEQAALALTAVITDPAEVQRAKPWRSPAKRRMTSCCSRNGLTR